MRLPILYLLPLSGRRSAALSAERKLPADLHIDLLFPRNETYAPVKRMPIVFGFQNLDAIWPLEMKLDVWVYSEGADKFDYNRTNRGYVNSNIGTDYGDLSSLVGHTPGKSYFYIRSVPMTNKAVDTINIAWTLHIKYYCFANESGPTDATRSGYNTDTDRPVFFDEGPPIYVRQRRVTSFSTAPGAKVPDIEATINACPEPEENTFNSSATIRITDLLGQFDSCAVIDSNATIAPETCLYRSQATEIANDASAEVLSSLRCDEGTWQTLEGPCTQNRSVAPPLRDGSSGILWVLPAAFVIWSIL